MHGPTKQIARCLVACVPVIGLAMAFGPAAGASTAHATHHARASHSASAIAAAKAELYKILYKQHDQIDWGTGAHSAVVNSAGLTKVDSTNWSGYADTGTGYKSVSAHWKEPTATCTSATSLAAFWVGIDGFTSDSVEQDGTLIECSGGSAFYFSWWEMFPTNDIQVVGETVNPGDSITASVTRSGTSYTLKLTDSTTSGNSFSTKQTCSSSSCKDTSAEWIAEAPSSSTGVEPLSHFSVWTASSAKVATTSKTGVISSFTDDEITMVDSSNNVKAQPGALNSTGNSFKVTWKRST
jgi:Peptidase A4 family